MEEKEKMNDILIICTHFSEVEAAYRRLAYFMTFLLQRGIKVRCLGFKLITKNGIYSPASQCMTGSFIISTRRTFAHIVNTFLSLPIIFHIILIKPKVLLLSVPDHFPLLPTYIGAKVAGSKLIIDFRDSIEAVYYDQSINNRFMRFIAKTIYAICRRSNAITAVTKTLATMLKEFGELTAIVVPNGADLTVFRSTNKSIVRQLLGLDDETFVIAYAGIIGAYHDLSEFIILIKRMNNRSRGRKIKLILAGPIMDEKHQALINSLTLKDTILYFGELNTEKLITVLSAADIGVIPLVSSTIFNYAVPIKFYEYIALGLPVLAFCNKDSELWKLIEENELGFVCRFNDLICIEYSLKALMLREVYSKIKANVEKFRSKIDRAVGAQILLAVLRRILNN